MASASRKFSRTRVLWGFCVTMHACLACSGAGTREPSDPSLGSAGTSATGGLGGCEASLGGAFDDCTANASAGARHGNGGSLGSAGHPDAAGAAGTAGAADGGASGTSAEIGTCGASGASSSDFVPAPHQRYPLVTHHGGPVLENIELVPVYFGDDPLRDDLERFSTWIVASDYWTQVGAQYGVHAGTRQAAVQFKTALASPISDTQIASWINARVADGSLPKPSSNTLFVLFFQAETKITFGTLASSCSDFAGLHEYAAIANPIFTGNVPFAVIPRCSFSPGDELMIATNTASHELFEAATDPLSLTNPAWQLGGWDGTPLEAWQILGGLELSDLCESHYYDVIDGFTVQRLWSNAAAQADDNPCQPSDPRHPFFSVTADTTIYHAQPGTTLTIHARAWSNRPAPHWEIGINWGYVPWSDFDGHAALSTTLVNNGDEITATVTIPANPAIVNGRSVYRFTIDSIDPINPNFANPWPFLVVVP
jgi:hypothetical protein